MEKNLNAAEKVIIALDVGDADKAVALVRRLDPAQTFKVGLRLFSAAGPSVISRLQELGKNVFLDLKLHDIPNTVAETVSICAGYGVRMMTLHASGGGEMMRRAAEAASAEAVKRGSPRPLLLAVTVLTSLKSEQLEEVGLEPDVLAQVLRLAALARRSGLDGVVCSPQEIESVKAETGKDFLVVAPGIRPLWSESHDQKRILTPGMAVRRGADYIVVGRPVIDASSPETAFRKIAEEIKSSVESADAPDGKDGA